MYVGAESILFFFLTLSCFPSHVSKERDGEETGTEHVLVDGKGQNNHNWEMFLLLLSVNITTSAAFHKRWLSFPLRRIKTTWILFIYCIILVFCITYLLYYTPIKVPPLLVWILLPQHWLFTNLGLNALNQQRVENESIPPPSIFDLGTCVCAHSLSCVCVWLPATLWNVACQAPLSMDFPKQEYWILEWFAISFSRGSSWPRDATGVSCISYVGRQILYCWATGDSLGNIRFL